MERGCRQPGFAAALPPQRHLWSAAGPHQVCILVTKCRSRRLTRHRETGRGAESERARVRERERERASERERERAQRVHLALRGEESGNNAAHKSRPPGGETLPNTFGGGRRGRGVRGAASRPPAGPGRGGGSAHLPPLPSSSPRARATIPPPPLPPGGGAAAGSSAEPGPRPAPLGAAGLGAGPRRRGSDVSPAGRAMVSAPQARVTAAGLAGPRPPRAYSPPKNNFYTRASPGKSRESAPRAAQPSRPPARPGRRGEPGSLARYPPRGAEGGEPPPVLPLAPPRASSHRRLLPSSLGGAAFPAQTCCRAAPGLAALPARSVPRRQPFLPRPPPPPPLPRLPTPDRLSQPPRKFHTLQINPRGGRAKRLPGGRRAAATGCGRRAAPRKAARPGLAAPKKSPAPTRRPSGRPPPSFLSPLPPDVTAHLRGLPLRRQLAERTPPFSPARSSPPPGAGAAAAPGASPMTAGKRAGTRLPARPGPGAAVSSTAAAGGTRCSPRRPPTLCPPPGGRCRPSG